MQINAGIALTGTEVMEVLGRGDFIEEVVAVVVVADFTKDGSHKHGRSRTRYPQHILHLRYQIQDVAPQVINITHPD